MGELARYTGANRVACAPRDARRQDQRLIHPQHTGCTQPEGQRRARNTGPSFVLSSESLQAMRNAKSLVTTMAPERWLDYIAKLNPNYRTAAELDGKG